MLIYLLRIALLSFLFIASPAYSAFRGFVSISPATESKHLNFTPVITIQDSFIEVKLPYVDNGSKKYWLVIADKPLNSIEQDFNRIKLLNARTDISLLTQLSPAFDNATKDQKQEIRLKLSHELARRAYIYFDFFNLVADGGYYYTIDIPSYIQKNKSE
jgi:hypothetical protein